MISKNAKETLENILTKRYHALKWYEYEELEHIKEIAKEHNFNELEKLINETEKTYNI